MSQRPNREGVLLPILIPVGALVLIGLVLYGFSRVLLATSPAAATAVALIVAVAVVAVAAVIASRRRQPNGALFSLFGVVAGVAMVAGGVAVLGFPPSEGEGEGFAALLAAPAGASADGFSPASLAVPSGEAFSIEFDNQDAGIQHNVVVFGGADADAPVLFEGEVITGAAKTTYALDPLEPASYFFNCAIHPTTMTGTIEASEGGGEGPGGEGGGGAGVAVSATGLVFDTDRIDLPADQPSKITFDNRDPAIPHNISIFADDRSLDEPLFDGPDITGPDTIVYDVPPLAAGTYYFHCDTHPTMNGSVVAEGGGEGGGSGSPPAGATGAAGGDATGETGPSG